VARAAGCVLNEAGRRTLGEVDSMARLARMTTPRAVRGSLASFNRPVLGWLARDASREMMSERQK
jgi:hypothetical protein